MSTTRYYYLVILLLLSLSLSGLVKVPTPYQNEPALSPFIDQEVAPLTRWSPGAGYVPHATSQ